MRKFVVLVCVTLMMGSVLFGQKASQYQFVVIPVRFQDIAKGFNPYNTSSKILQVLATRKITAVFEGNKIPGDPCSGLTVNLENASSMFRTGVVLNLRNCNNEVVWTGKGKGFSKDFVTGYGEAIEAALADLKELPNMDSGAQSRVIATSSPSNTTVPVQPAVAVAVAVPTTTAANTAEESAGKAYNAKNMYYNDTYMMDVVDSADGSKILKVINGNLLGYQKLQSIAILSPSGIDDSYLVRWTTPQGEVKNGMAKLSANKLTISLPGVAGSAATIIELLKP